MRVSSIIVWINILLLSNLPLSCGGGDACPEGSHAESGVCISDCSEGMSMQDGKCVSDSGFWDDGDVADGDTVDGDTADGDAQVDGDEWVDGDVPEDGDASEDADGDEEMEGDEDLSVLSWYDPEFYLTWENPGAEGWMTWGVAENYCKGLVLEGYTDWRLPTVAELRSLVRDCVATNSWGDCKVKDGCLTIACRFDVCDGCLADEGPADAGCYWPSELKGFCDWYWSSSIVDGFNDNAWFVDFHNAAVDFEYRQMAMSVRCVRQ